jgi:hypothetical protein
LGGSRRFGSGKSWVPTARRRPARRSSSTWGAFDVASCAFGYTSCLSILGESDGLEVDDFPWTFSNPQKQLREGKIEGFS